MLTDYDPDLIDFYADVDWTTGRLGVCRTDDDEAVAEGDVDLAHVDFDDEDDDRRPVITDALAAIGYRPVPGEEWLHIEGGLGTEEGGERIPVELDGDS